MKQQTCRAGSMRYFSWRHSQSTTDNIVKPVLVLLRTFVKMYFIRSDLRLHNFGLTCLERRIGCTGRSRICIGNGDIPPSSKNPYLCSFDPYPIRIVSTNLQYQSIGIFCFDQKRSVNIPQPRFRKFCLAHDLNRSCKFCPHSPMRDIDMMNPPTGDHTSSKLFESQPSWS